MKKHVQHAQSVRQLPHALRLLAVVLVGWAVVEQLRKPASERTWRGLIWGVVPYDFRPPTVARIKAALWNPLDRRLFTARSFGVGWSINLYEARRRLIACCRMSAPPASEVPAPAVQPAA